ncbi:hypothetical protein [Facilibium subflavum]|uniref:hypothetical protein n=1 Tax=Facilibium subflavum TaxID=2219058 RepID=UPI000E657C7A|nr:hypothetical protein [Facilibium subflavum]
MGLEDLKQQAQNLQSRYRELPNRNDAWKDQLLIKYTQRVAREIIEIIDQSESEETKKQALQELLANNWNEVKNSALAYTAIPESDATKLLIDVVEYLAPEKPSKQLKLLMPDLQTEYTDIQDHMPQGASSLTDILKTHILTHNGQFLAHIDFLLTPGEQASQQPYFQHQYNASLPAEDNRTYYVAGEDAQRLVNHSPLTQRVWQARENLAQAKTEGNNLLAQLEQLLIRLHANSKDGVGSELKAGSGGALAIAAFFKFYKQLSKAQRQAIPDAVKQQIKWLGKCINYYDDIDSFRRTDVDSQNLIWTCLATRRDELKASMQGHTERLLTIAMSGQKKQMQIKALEKELEDASNALESSLAEGLYSGEDALPVSMMLLERYGMDLVNRQYTFDDVVALFNNFSQRDLKVLLQNHAFCGKLADAIGTADNLAVFAASTSVEKYALFLQTMTSSKLKSLLYNQSNPLYALIATLSPAQIPVILSAIKDQRIINLYNFKIALKWLLPEQQTAVLDYLMSLRYPNEIINDFHALDEILREIDTSQRNAFLTGIGNQLTGLITNPYAFSYIAQHLNKAQCDFLVDNLQVVGFVQNAGGLGYILHGLKTDQQIERVLDQFLDSLSEWINNLDDLYCIIQHLNSVQWQRVFDQLGEKIMHIITAEDAKTIKSLFEGLDEDMDEAKRNILFDRIKLQLVYPNGVIKNAEDFGFILEHLNAERRSIVFENNKSQLTYPGGLIKNAQDLAQVLKFLTPEQCEVVLAQIEFKDFLTMLKEAVHSHDPADNLNTLLRKLQPEQRNHIFEKIKDNLDEILDSDDDENLGLLLQYFNDAQQAFILNHVESQLLAGKAPLIRNANELVFVLRHLSPDRCKAFLATINIPKDKKGEFNFANSNILSLMQVQLKPAQYEACLGFILKNIETGQCKEVLRKLQQNGVIRSVTCLQSFLPELPWDKAQIVRSMIDIQANNAPLPYHGGLFAPTNQAQPGTYAQP